MRVAEQTGYGIVPPASGAMGFADESEARPLWALRPGEIDTAGLDAATVDWARAAGFSGKVGEALPIPDSGGTGVAGALIGLGPEDGRVRFAAAAARSALPEGTWRLASTHAADERDEIALSWLFAGYRFDAYKAAKPPKAALVAPEGCDATRLEAMAEGERITRWLIDTPARDAGPAEIAEAAVALGGRHGMESRVIEGAELLDGFPLIAAVGGAAAPGREPRLVDLRRRGEGPKVTLVGKGVAFDTGGLNLKSGASMGLMKKDMGGAATVLGLMHMLLATEARMDLRVLLPIAENAVSGPAMRPGDILLARNGLTVEVNNTDAEGRLILADALALASEDGPDAIVSMATLTGAARVAVGPDIAPFFTGDERLAAALTEAGERVRDPIWRLPFHAPYEPRIEPSIADLDNAPKGGMAGAITAALFLRRFVGEASRYTHLDVFGWSEGGPGRPKGGFGMGARALLAALPEALG